MSRHKHRLGRLTQRHGGTSAEDLERARLERMTDEEIEAELVSKAVAIGFDADEAAQNPRAALKWIEGQFCRAKELGLNELPVPPDMALPVEPQLSNRS